MQQLIYVSAKAVHDIRHQLQLILAVADGQNAPIIERAAKEINNLLPPHVRYINSVTTP